MSRQSTSSTVATIGIDLGKNTFHLVGLDQRGNIVLQLKTSREQLERRLTNIPRCLIGMEACSGSHHIGRRLEALGHEVRLIPAQYVKPFLKGHKNDYRDAEAVAEAVQRPTMHFVSIKTPDQMDLLALHRVRSRLVSQRTGVINQIRGFLLERGVTVRQGPVPLAKALSDILSSSTAPLSPRLVRLITDLAEDWRRLDDRIAMVSTEIEALAEQDTLCQRLMTVPGIGPIISSAVVAAIGNGTGFKQGRDFGAWLGLVPKQESTGDRTIGLIHCCSSHVRRSRNAILLRTAGPYILAQSGHPVSAHQCPLLGVKRTLIRRSKTAFFVSLTRVQENLRLVGLVPRWRISRCGRRD
jgi:transposase